MNKKWISLLLIMVFLTIHTSIAFGDTTSRIERIYNETGDFLENQEEMHVGSVGGEWSIIGLARAGRELQPKQQKEYLESVVEYVDTNIDDNLKLDPNRSTEHSRIILALTAIGEDPTNFAGKNLIYALGDFDYVKRQGINGPIWALIALDSNDYEIPTHAKAVNKTTREGLINHILENACTDGGWTFYGNVADPDMTAMAIQSLTPYYRKNTEVKIAIDKALDVLSNLQEDSGAYISYGDVNVESTSQVLVALSQLGIDATTDTRFIKYGNTLLDGIEQFAVEGGGFRHILSGERDGMATEQGYYALVSYHRFIEGKAALYDMTDVQSAPQSLPIISILCVVAAIFTILMICKIVLKRLKTND